MGRRKRVAYICQQNLPSVQKKEKIQENDLENDSLVHSDETPQEEMSNPPTIDNLAVESANQDAIISSSDHTPKANELSLGSLESLEDSGLDISSTSSSDPDESCDVTPPTPSLNGLDQDVSNNASTSDSAEASLQSIPPSISNPDLKSQVLTTAGWDFTATEYVSSVLPATTRITHHGEHILLKSNPLTSLDQLHQLSFLLNGQYYSDYHATFSLMGLPMMSSTTWDKLVSWLGKHVEALAKKS